MQQDIEEKLLTGRWNFFSSILVHRRLPFILALVAIVLSLPSLNTGIALDDYHHKLAMKESDSLIRMVDSQFDLFRFFDGSDNEKMQKIQDYGLVPWWSYENIKAALFRPLVSLTHWLDYKLWPDIPALMHAHSILWYAALVAALVFLYRRLMGLTLLAGLAALLYAIDDAHSTPISFLANRNALLSTFFGVLTIIAHDHWRSRSWRAGTYIGPLLLVLSLLSKEAGVATCAYLFAYALFIDSTSWRRRLMSLIPYFAVVVVWRITWTKLGYGIENIGGYVDPLKDPADFITAVKNHLPLFLLGQWTLPPAELSFILEPAKNLLLYRIAVAFMIFLAVILVPLLQRDRIARFWALGMFLSIIPICATMPHNRLLIFTGIGAMGLLARFLTAVFQEKERNFYRRKLLLAVGIVFVILHLIISPVSMAICTSFAMAPEKFENQLLLYEPMDSSIVDQDLIVVNPPVALLATYAPIIWQCEEEPIPSHYRILTSSLFKPVKVERRDEYTLLVRPLNGYLAWVGDCLFRSRKFPMSLGQKVLLPGMTVEITKMTPNNRPKEAAFTFDVPLEDPSLRWLQFKDGRYVTFTPPPIGQIVTLYANIKF